VHAHGEARLLGSDLDVAAREGVGGARLQALVIADLDDGLQRRREIAAVVGEDGGADAQLRLTDGRFVVGAELVIEAPRQKLLAQTREDGIAMRLGDLRQDRLGLVELEGEGLAHPVGVAHPGAGGAAPHDFDLAVAVEEPEVLLLDPGGRARTASRLQRRAAAGRG
jgi:hypothetical protein